MSLLKERKDKLKTLHEQIKSIKHEMGEIIRPFIEDEWWIGFEYICIPFWDCPKSPVGWCVYNHETDPAHDNCIYCNEPLERS